MVHLKKQFLIYGAIFSLIILVAACSKEDPVYSTPQISISGDSFTDLSPGETATVNLQLNGDGGAKSVVVLKNGGFHSETPVHATATEFVYTTDPLSDGLAEGEEVEYSFKLSNLNGVDSEEVKFTIKTALYNLITIGNTNLFNLNIGSEGIVPSGTEIKLIKGRNYFVPFYLTFESGAKLIVEEGVHLYMNVDAENNAGIDIQGEAEIIGTAEEPVVMTSSRVLTSPAEVSPGDWDEFRLSGDGASSNNGVVSYLRIEYGNDRAFRLSDVGAATKIDHIQVYKTVGEGVMITNGNAQLKYIVATDCEGGSYRLGDAYSGNMQFIISVNSEFYADNDDFTVREEASPVISNATILGAGADLDDNTHGMRFRANSSPKVYNTIIAEFPRRGLRAADEVKITDMNGSTVFAHSFIFSVPRDPFRELATAFAGTFNEDGSIATNPFSNNATNLSGSTYTLTEIDGIGVADFVPTTAQSSSFNASSLGSFFSNADYVGAVKDASNDWTKGWVKNPDGTIR